MDNPQLQPLEVNPHTGEPFLRLRSHKNIIITPPRLSDAPSWVTLLNDERIYRWLCSPPYPYLPEHAEAKLKEETAAADKLFAELETARDDVTLKIVDGCPVWSIREVKDDGTDVFIGKIRIRLLEGTGRETQPAPLRDPSNPDVWSWGDFLAPSHHGQGIMTDAVLTVLHEWGIPRMGVRRMCATTLEGNQGSVRVFEKCGFKFRETLANRLNGVHVLDWSWEDVEGTRERAELK
ncbi:acyl-CoA N-acyltransferase [Mycena rebaudengoi]|nr:acyl-CoA N-acyltransferase [Mycena rebaudengoi]